VDGPCRALDEHDVVVPFFSAPQNNNHLKGEIMKTRNYLILCVVFLILTTGFIVRADRSNEESDKSLDNSKSYLTKLFENPKVDRFSFWLGLMYAQHIEEELINDVLREDSLAGLGGVCVVVENVRPEVEKYGLTNQLLQIDTELRLRQYGIRVFNEKQIVSLVENFRKEQNGVFNANIQRVMKVIEEEQSHQAFLHVLRNQFRNTKQIKISIPHLYINVNTIMYEERNFAAFSISMELRDSAYLSKDHKRCTAVVWQENSLNTCSLSSLKAFVRESLRDEVDKFINDYLAANPKEQPAEKKDKDTK
jgi:hypothetical protein